MPAPARLSVIIPTHNRSAVLRKALEAYLRQTALEEILEILIVDDGSTDGTSEVVSEIAETSSIPIRYLRQENKGLAAARNYGIRKATGAIVLFTDDDAVPTPNLVEEHIAWHRQHPGANFALMGYLPWSPEVHATPLMRWSIRRGPQFAYDRMEHGQPISSSYCYFNNTSVKAAFLLENGLFDEAFRTWGWEDWELGYRLMQKGMVMVHNVNAIGFHYKHVAFADLCQIPLKSVASTKVASSTEAGRLYLEQEPKRKASRQYRLKRLLARVVVPVLAPLRLLFDSPIPLPAVIYRLFYFYYAVLPVEGIYRSIEGALQPAQPGSGCDPSSIPQKIA